MKICSKFFLNSDRVIKSLLSPFKSYEAPEFISAVSAVYDTFSLLLSKARSQSAAAAEIVAVLGTSLGSMPCITKSFFFLAFK